MSVAEPSLDFEELRRHCVAETGLSDFGNDDVFETFRRLTASWDQEGQMTAQGRAAKRAGVIRALTNRLKLQNALKEHPEILEERITKPLVIVGLPRSGTTKLHRMIAADPAMQKIPFWRALNPLPVGAPGEPDRRVAVAEGFVDVMRKNQPDLYAAHPMVATEPDEDVFALEITGKVYTNCSAVRSPSFKAWLDRQPFDNVYRWLRQLLQITQYFDHGQGKPWILKAPQHMGFLPDLFGALPEAVIVHCHREPIVNIASYAAMITSSRRSMCATVDPAEVGQYAVQFWSGLMRRYLEARPRYETKHRFIDVSYRDIVGNGIEAIARIYAEAEVPLSGGSRDAMVGWETANSQHKHGRHRYDLADAGLTEREVSEAFAPYVERYSRYF